MREPAAASAPSSGPAKSAIEERAKRAADSFKVAVKTVEDRQAALPAGKLDPASDTFYMRFDRRKGNEASAAAMRNCYGGGLARQERDAYINIEFDVKVKNGEVTYSNVKALETTITDKALQACMVKQVALAHFHDDELPDRSETDRVTITPERVYHKYMNSHDD
jgi:hypothetical protein